MKVARSIAVVTGIFFCVVTILAFIRTDQWWVRIFDFPRVQLIVLGLLALVVMIITRKHIIRRGRILIVLLTIAIVVQAWFIYPYTPLAAEQVRAAKDDTRGIGVFVANVFEENRESEELLRQIAIVDTDIILLTETDQWWTDAVKVLEKSHPHTVLRPQDNTYGMNLYSRMPLIAPEIRFIIDPEIPSIRTHLELDGRSVLFHGLHPTPPGIKHPSKDELQDSDERDAELIVVAKELENEKAPYIIAGDFNDVAWSHTTRLFQRTSRSLDPRVGRGFFNTYHAGYPLFRYPLDHLFHSDHFTLVSIQRMDDVGSDHFPMHVRLDLEPEAAAAQEAPAPKDGDEEEEGEILERAADKDQE